MSDLKDKVKLYLVDRDPGDENDVRVRLAPDLKPGERIINGRRVYSAAWLDEEGNEHEFQA